MSKPIAVGDRIRVNDREPTVDDVKSQLFYEHYRNLAGTVAKLYADGTASIDVEPGTLPKEIATRHATTSEGLRQRWLDGISEEARNKMSAAEKVVSLRYTILVSQSDLSPLSATEKVVAAVQKPPAKAKPLEQAQQPVETLELVMEAPRKTLAELEAEEERHLEEIRRNKA